jgi:hypothetical protein
MKIIVHTDDPDLMHYAMLAVKTCIGADYAQCGHTFGKPIVAEAFTKRRKTGWTVWVNRPASLEKLEAVQ